MALSNNKRRVTTNQRRYLMQTAVSNLCKYYGVQNQLDLLNSIGLNGTSGNTRESRFVDRTATTTNPIGTDIRPNQSVEGQIMNIIFDDNVGTRTMQQIIDDIQPLISANNNAVLERFNNTLEIYSDLNNSSQIIKSKISSMFPVQDDINTPNVNEQRINEESYKNLSAVIVNTSQISFTQRMNNAATLFFNTIPNLDINQINPYLDISFKTPRSPITSNPDSRINGMSLMKFLEGSKIIRETETDYILTLANAAANPRRNANGTTVSNPNGSEQYTQAGMELFTTPQSLVNANFVNNPTLHSQKILDKFQPFLSLKSLDLNLVPTHGLMSNKTGTMTLKLHDRSRLADIAEFIRPEYYGANEIIIEYGWYHPQGELLQNGRIVSDRNYIADLLNGMRIIEKFQILNSSFNMTDNGEVDITLTISMRGGSDLDTESILTNDDAVASSLQTIQRTQEAVIRLRNSIYGNGNSSNSTNEQPTREIRGTQILDAASDGANHLIMTRELNNALTTINTTLNRGGRPDAAELRTQLSRYRQEVLNIQNSLSNMLKTKFAQLKSGDDPFKENAFKYLGLSQEEQNLLGRKLEVPNNVEARGFLESIGAAERQEGSFSLAKILLLFVGIPLKQTGKFDDVQFYFYPFNINAAKANVLNTGEYVINADLFYVKFMQWRLGNLGHTSNINIRDFISWIASTFLDDPVSPVYGLRNFYKRVINAEGVSVTQNDRAVSTQRGEDRSTNYLLHLNETIREYTPTGEFRVPQIEVYFECLPGITTNVDSNGTTTTVLDETKTILKIHVFDRLNNPYESLQQLNKMSRDNVVSNVGLHINNYRSAQDTINNNQPLNNRRQSTADRNARAEALNNATRSRTDAHEQYNTFLQMATQRNLIESYVYNETQADGGNPVARTRYRMAGGTNSAQNLKNFFYSVCPYIIYGSAASVIKNASLRSIQNSRLTTVNFLRNHTASPLEANGENPGGLPMQIIPTELELDMLGCTFINFAQTFFIDFNTGTTADNFYTVVGVNHTFGGGEFNTKVKLSPTDGYGQYINILQQINSFEAELQNTPPSTNNSSNQ